MAEPNPNTKWREIVARYQTPSVKRAVWQLVSTLVPLVGAVSMPFTMPPRAIWSSAAPATSRP